MVSPFPSLLPKVSLLKLTWPKEKTYPFTGLGRVELFRQFC